MGTIRDQKTGKTIGTVSLLMDCTGYRYWEGQIKDGPCKRFYFVDHGVGSGVGATCEFEAVRWVMDRAEEQGAEEEEAEEEVTIYPVYMHLMGLVPE
jgi:hypothetical protein